MTAGSGLDVQSLRHGRRVGDYDNDGLADVFITAVGGNRLFHNKAAASSRRDARGRRRRARRRTGARARRGLITTTTGELDLFVCNYVRWSREIDSRSDYKLDGIGRAYGQPMNFEGAFPRFTTTTATARFTRCLGDERHPGEESGDGRARRQSARRRAGRSRWRRLDRLVVANDTVQNFVFTTAATARSGRSARVPASPSTATANPRRDGHRRGALSATTTRWASPSAISPTK